MLIVLMVSASCLSSAGAKGLHSGEGDRSTSSPDSKGPSWGRSQLVIGTLGVLAAEEYSDLILQLGMFQSCFGCIQVVPTAPRLEAGLFFTALEQGIAGLRVKKVSYACFVSGSVHEPNTKGWQAKCLLCLCGWQFVLSL